MSEEDLHLEEMLRQAALLEARMKSSCSQGDRSSQEGSVQTKDHSVNAEESWSGNPGDGSMFSEEEDSTVDDMLHQAELLAAKMRGPGEQAAETSTLSSALQYSFQAAETSTLSSVLQYSEDQSDTDVSMDDMLRKAELLARQMQGVDTTPPAVTFLSPGATKAPFVESTPALIRHSERLLAEMHTDEQSSDEGEDMSTPDLMRQTAKLLEITKSSPQPKQPKQMMVERESENGEESIDDILSRTDMLLAQMKSWSSTTDQKATSTTHQTSKVTPPSPKVTPPSSKASNDLARSEELRHIMEQALSNWTNSADDTDRIKDALMEQIMPKLLETPSTVSFKETDEVSSVGSLSPRTHPSRPTESVKSLLTPPDRSASGVTRLDRPPLPPQPPLLDNADAAVDRSHNVADSLKEAYSETRDKVQVNSEQEAVAKKQPPPPPVPPPPAEPNRSEEDRRMETMPSNTRAKKEFAGPSQSIPQYSSEEAQYSAIMAAIDSAPKNVSWERVESVSTNDDDFVPLVDYSKKSSQKSRSAVSSSGVGPVGRSRQSKLAKFVIAVVVLVACGFLGVWISRGTNETATAQVYSSSGSGDSRYEDRHLADVHDSTVEKNPDIVHPDVSGTMGVNEQQATMDASTHEYSRGEVVNEDASQKYQNSSTAISQKSPKMKIAKVVRQIENLLKRVATSLSNKGTKMKVAKVVRHVGSFVVRVALSLTPPTTRFCPLHDKEACEDTTFLMTSLGVS